jgi:para-nitrobenzyl esterase
MSSENGPVVTTGQGPVQGVSVTAKVSGYFGIPYAAPPVGRLRWRPPVEPESWTDKRDGSKFGPDPVQPKGIRVSRAPGMSEDCLYVNIWTPKDRRQGGWPVMVWACGGAFTTGSGAFVEEDPAQLAARGAVVVSFNVRLGLFGFLAHPGLSAESAQGSSGNYGLLDQAAALRWVRENVYAFNGDSDRITFFGQSAGATLGMLLLSSPIVRQPYDRAIFQSPGSFSKLLGQDVAERHGEALGDDLDALRSLSTAELLEHARNLPAAKPSLWLARPLRPIVDGWLITSDEPMTPGNFAAVPAIIGTNEDEGGFFGPRMGIKTIEDYVKFVQGIFGRNTAQALKYYPVETEGDVPWMFSAVYADRGFNFPIAKLVRAFAQSDAAVFRYVYSYRPNGRDVAPTHADEASVLTGTRPDMSDRDAEMSELMARYWISFAENGRPAGQALPAWPQYSEAKKDYLKLDIPPATHSAWREDLTAFVEEAHAD